MMPAAEVLLIVSTLEAAGIGNWLDGGWGIDALLGEETRDHDDLDLVIGLGDAAAAQGALAPLGYGLVLDELPTRFVMQAPEDRRIDFHTVTFDRDGGGIQRLQDGAAWRYPPEGFAGEGRVGGRAVCCLTPEVQILCHVGYEPDAADRHDLARLRQRFGVELPPPYDKD